MPEVHPKVSGTSVDQSRHVSLHCTKFLRVRLQGYIVEAQAAVTASKSGEHSGEVVPLRGVPKDVEMSLHEQSPTALTLKAVNPMDGHFVGSLDVTQEAAAELAGAARTGTADTSGHRSESLIQVSLV